MAPPVNYLHGSITDDPLPHLLMRRYMEQLDGPTAKERMEHISGVVRDCLPLTPRAQVHRPTTSNLHFGGGAEEDYISRLPEKLLSDIVSRLPTRDAARTAVLSSRWRGVWASTPLVLDDDHLPFASDKRSLVRAIERIVTAHPGPIRCVRITSIAFADEHEDALRRLVEALSTKRLEELILVNRPWPLTTPLPADVLQCASLRSLHLGFWRFPDATTVRDDFTDLREFGLYSTTAYDRNFQDMLARCPNLESLFVVHGSACPGRIQLIRSPLRCVVLWLTILHELDISDAPCLERLVLHHFAEPTCIKIGYAPKLEAFGYFDPRFHQLVIGETAVEVGTKVSCSDMVWSLKVLALDVRFGVKEEAKLVPVLLQCFPRLETLYITSVKSKELTCEVPLQAWQQKLDSLESVWLRLNKVVFQGFRGKRRELVFLKAIVRTTRVLKALHIVLDDGVTFAMVENKLKPLRPENLQWASTNQAEFCVIGGIPCARCFRRASDLSRSDPFGIEMSARPGF